MKYILFTLLICAIGHAQNDTIRLHNGDQLAGEIKLISNGVLTIKTPYSDKDFRIEFNKVEALVIQTKSLIILTNDRRRFGYVSTNKTGKISILLDNNLIEEYDISEVIALQEVKEDFFHRFKAYVDLSYNFTKANSGTQFTAAGKLMYNSEFWLSEGFVNTMNSNQDQSDRIRRTEANLKLIRILARKLYLIGELPFLSNTEQALDARITPSVGIGKYIVSTNKLYLGLSTGLTWNNETYTDSSLDKNSTELFLSLGLNLFDFEDIDLDTDIKFYPSLTEKGRLRTDYNFNFKYDLPLDFYIKLGFSLNYDNKPAITGNQVDYVFTSGFGWKFD
jgi:putative salt-induced outer membrane protein YdiY